jgi:nucleotide-binding universal stress UspA family protein
MNLRTKVSRSEGQAEVECLVIAIRKILVPVDFSKPSVNSAHYALGLCRLLGARLKLVHVIETGPLLTYGGTPMVVDSMALEESLRESAESEMRKLEQRLRAPRVQVSSEVVTHSRGVPDRICELASEFGADWIVLATHGRSGFNKFILGSMADKVVRMSPCPVLTVRDTVAKKNRRR